MNTRALECFLKVYEKKSISAAAKEVFISPQGLSKVIKQLEIDLEAELFFRGPQGMVVTEAGELLYARAKHIIYLMDDIRKEINIINGNKDVLNVIITFSAASAVPPEMIFEFTKQHPEIQIKLQELPDELQIEELFMDEADVGIIMNVSELLGNCKYESLISGEMILVVPKTHRFATAKKVSIMELKNEPLLLKSSENMKVNPFIEKCHNLGFEPEIVHETGNILTLHRLSSELGVPAVSTDFIENSIIDENASIVKLSPQIPQNIYMISHNRESLNRAGTLFQDYIKDNLKSRGSLKNQGSLKFHI
ncbi:MAG: LysR family transcriptional regulator [Spirochaetales bacterium]|nr:LysR family transcriptional regulator [Spirochaetales bacterium]